MNIIEKFKNNISKLNLHGKTINVSLNNVNKKIVQKLCFTPITAFFQLSLGLSLLHVQCGALHWPTAAQVLH